MSIFRNAKPEQYGSDIKIGHLYREPRTGIEGTATALHFYEHACERVTLEYMDRDNVIQEVTFDAPRVRLVTKPDVPVTTTRTGGPARAGERRPVSSR
jgi:hypothetical protein